MRGLKVLFVGGLLALALAGCGETFTGCFSIYRERARD
jgi:hypothetical protein